MPNRLSASLFFLGTFLFYPLQAKSLEIFAKGTASKNYIASDSWEESISATAGLAFTLFSTVRFEARYTNSTSLQNNISVVGASAVGTLTNVLTESENLSGGLDIAFTGDKSVFQPFLYLGAGYIVSQRSYYFTPVGTTQSIYAGPTTQEGITGNLGAGFRLLVAHHLAIEIEAFGYAMDIDKPNPLINFSGSAGIRIFI